MRAGIFLQRRNAHQALDGEAVNVAAARHEGDGLGRLDASLLRLRARVDLHVELRRLALLLYFLGDLAGDLVAVDRLDRVEQRYRLPGLVGLQGTDEMQLDI